jgi:hypothetical protein
MATIVFRQIFVSSNMQVFQWGPMAAGDTCVPLEIGNQWPLLANVQFTGTFGGPVAFEGSNDATNYAGIQSGGAAISATAAGAFDFSSAMRMFRPNPGAGVGSVTVTLCMRS